MSMKFSSKNKLYYSHVSTTRETGSILCVLLPGYSVCSRGIRERDIAPQGLRGANQLHEGNYSAKDRCLLRIQGGYWLFGFSRHHVRPRWVAWLFYCNILNSLERLACSEKYNKCSYLALIISVEYEWVILCTKFKNCSSRRLIIYCDC